MFDGLDIHDARCACGIANFARYRAGRVLTALCPPLIVGFLLTGCAFLPMPVQAVSWAIDGVSYMATNKSVLDHGISQVSGQDCAAFRIVTEGAACRDIMSDPDLYTETSTSVVRTEISTSAVNAEFSAFVVYMEFSEMPPPIDFSTSGLDGDAP